jgi:PKD repeat protein
MRLRGQVAGIWGAFQKNWRVRPHCHAREQLIPQLIIRQLEERRVLTVSVNAALLQAGPGGGDQTAVRPDPAVSAHSDTSVAAALSNASVPAAVNSATASIAAANGNAASNQEQVGVPTLTVARNQTVDEGSLLSIANIGQFSDSSPSGTGFTYSIDWGDGTSVDSGSATINSPGPPTTGSFNGAHTYAGNGIYTVTVTLADNGGGSDTGTLSVTVNNVAPTLTVAPNQTTNEGSLLSITNIGQFTDPGFDNPLNVGGETSETFTYAINWGDGTFVDSGPGTITTPGSPGVLTAGSFDGAHTYANTGIYTVTVTLSDDNGGKDTGTFSVTVNNVAPTLTVAPNQTASVGTLLSIPKIGQFTDPGFDNPLNVGGETSESFTYAINWGDGTFVDSGPGTITTPGSPGVLTAGSFDGAHIYANTGIYTVTVTLSDDNGGKDTGTFLVTVPSQTNPLTFNVGSNQTINEGSLLSVNNIGLFSDSTTPPPTNFTYTINWGDGRPLDSGTAAITTPGSEGVPTAGSFNGAHTYADNGLYTVTVTLEDHAGNTTSGTFQVTVNNVAPTLTVVPNQTIDEGSLLSINNLGQFTDPGFDNPLNVGGQTSETFTYTINWGDGTTSDAGPGTVNIHGSPGVLTAGSFNGSHTYADNGVYTVHVTVSDDDGGTTAGSFQVTVNNVAPTMTVVPNQTVNEGSLLSITDLGKFTDPGFDNPLNVGGQTSETFTYTINWGDGTTSDAGPGTINIHGSPGVLTAGSFNGAHIYADNGVYTVHVTVSDDDGGTTAGSFQVTVNNVAPSLILAANPTVNEGSLLSLPVLTRFTDPGFNNPLNVGGPTQETFTYTLNWGDGSSTISAPAPATNGSRGVLTAGAIAGSHTYADDGVYTVTVTVTDDGGGKTTGTILVTVNNVAPTVTVGTNLTVNEGSLLSINDIGQYTDPGFDNPLAIGGPTSQTFTYTVNWGDGRPLDGAAAPIAVHGSVGVLTAGAFNGSHTYADDAVYRVTASVRDDDGGVGVNTFFVTVLNVPPSLTLGVGNQQIAQSRPLALPNLGTFTDPGFDNPLNVGGQTTQQFNYIINWGDGTALTTGPAGITLDGSPGVLTAGAFAGLHTFGGAGQFTVTVTLRDDDGGSSSGSFQVTVAALPHPQILRFDFGAAAPVIIPPPVVFAAAPPPVTPYSVALANALKLRGGSVAGSELRLVLRIVSPGGKEGKDHDEPLAHDVLDSLRGLFGRLPDGHYRIYQIQPDGIERLVVDMLVREGRSIDASDEMEATPDAPQTVPSALHQQPAATPLEFDAAVREESTVSHQAWPGVALALGGGYVAYSVPGRSRLRVRPRGDRSDDRSLTKTRRLLRRPRVS